MPFLKAIKPALIDTHAHVNFNAYKSDAAEVIQRSLEAGVFMINVGSNYVTSQRAAQMAEKYDGVWAAVGLHPIHLETGLVKIKDDPEEIQFKTIEESFDYEKYRALAQSSKKAVAIGETGLDYYYRPKTKTKMEQFKEKQKEVFLKQVELASGLGLPLIIHCRSAHDELIEILKYEFLNLKSRGVIHCFTGNWEQAQKYMEMGFCLGLNGIIFKLNIDDVIKKTPLDRILLETDCPYLTPKLMEGRNEPLYVKYVAEKIAEIKNLSNEEIENITTQNAKKLFKI